VGTTAFEVIVKKQIRRLEEPSLRCCQLVYDELIRILGQLLVKTVGVRRVEVVEAVLQADMTYHPNIKVVFQALPGAARSIQLGRHQLFQRVDGSYE
jgi:hypothetical protein